MKNLWTVLPPLLADNFGFLEAVNASDGCGVIDDSGDYRTGGHNDHGGHEGYSGHEGHGGHQGHGGHEGHGGRGGREGGRPHGGKHRGSGRTAVSGASSEDVVTGTRSRILEAFQEAKKQLNPQFVLFSAGPCGAMIGTDLEEIAETVSQETGLPAAAVNLTGQKPYDIGLSKTLEAMAKLLTKPMTLETGTVNLLGGSGLDWSPEDVAQTKAWIEAQGLHVLAQPGGKVTAAQLETMAKAQINLVTTVSGLAAARYLQAQFGTPYIAMTPFGSGNCKRLLEALEVGRQPEARIPEAPAETLIIGEQLTANAIRWELEASGAVKSADVATFYSLDKTLARPHDRRIRGEDDARALLQSGGYRLILADPLLRCFAPNGCKWVDLRHRAFNTYGEENDAPVLTAGKLNTWLDRNL
ncbi:MAG: nitrogenase component 1 [Faecousia sp.]